MNPHRPAVGGGWPNGAAAAVSLTFDVDAESSPLGQSEANRARLTTLSEARFGVVRGLPRILDLLSGYGLHATFYVPGHTAELHPAAIAGIAERGHEIGHHGYLHRRSDELSDDEQALEVEQGIDALERHAGVRPSGYRSPAWELTPTTLRLLVENEFAYDSSCMGDDRPYIEEHGPYRILELPVHWSLDDVPYFVFGGKGGGHLGHPSALLEAWLSEFDAAVEEGRHLTLTMHPEVIGRSHRLRLLEQLVAEMHARGNVWFATHGEVASHVATSLGDGASSAT